MLKKTPTAFLIIFSMTLRYTNVYNSFFIGNLLLRKTW